MDKKIMYGIGFCLLAITNVQAATVTEWATVASGSDLNSGINDGGSGISYAYVSGATFQAEASLSGASYTPLLRAESVSTNPENADDRTSAYAAGFQVFTSSISQSITLDLSLHGIVSNTSEGSSYVLGDVKVVGGSNFFTQDTYCTNGTYAFGTYLCGSNLGSANMPIRDGDITLADSITFNVTAGESFAVYGVLRASSYFGSADAYHTLSMSFENDTYLSAASASAVPVPAAVWLFLSGLAGMIGVARVKQS